MTSLTPLWPLVSMRRLEQLLGSCRVEMFSLAARAGGCYRSYDQERSGKKRRIDDPAPYLKDVQRRICRVLLRSVSFPPGMHGGVPGASICTNARGHLHTPLVVTLDLRDCFPRTSYQAVYRAYRGVFGCSRQIASLLTKLTTFHRHLPQGAPTSTPLANICLLPMYADLQELASGLDLQLSMYIDDIAFSGCRAREAIQPALVIIRRHGYAVRNRKICIMPATARQEVTGVVVNRRLGVRREYRQAVRAEILAAANRPAGPVKDRIVRSVKGRITHATAISPTHGRRLAMLATRVLFP